jgi:hypothetical protein
MSSEINPAPRRHRFVTTDGSSAERRARKQVVKAIHIKDEVFRRAERRFDLVLKSLEDDVESKALVVRAPSGAGKTHLLGHLATDPRLVSFQDEFGDVRPLVRVSAPSPCTLKTLGIVIHRALTGIELSARLPAHDIWVRVRTNMYNMRVSVVMIDELHHVFANKNKHEQEDVISTLKALLLAEDDEDTIGKLPATVVAHPLGLVLSGMPTLTDVIRLDLQLQRRCIVHEFKPLILDKVGEPKFKGFLQRYAKGLGFPNVPDFTSADMLLRLHKASGGYRGRAAFFIKEAAYRAIDYGHSTVDRALHLAEVFEDIFETGDERNPFLVADVNKLGPVKELDDAMLTRLRGKRKLVDDDFD